MSVPAASLSLSHRMSGMQMHAICAKFDNFRAAIRGIRGNFDKFRA